MKNLVIFYPSYERGGATKVLENLIYYCAKKNIKLYIIINKNLKYNKNILYIKISNRFKFIRSRFFSSLFGSIKLIKILSKLNTNKTRVLSMQSNLFSSLISKIFNFKIAIRVSEDPCGATKYADKKLISYVVLLSKLLTYNLANKIIVNSKKSFLCTQKFCLNKKKVKILYNPSLKKITKFKKRNNKKVFLNIGRYCKQKNQQLLIRSFANFIKKEKNYKIIFIGDGPDKIKLLQLVKDLNIKQNISFKNWNSNLISYFKKSSAFILTSLYEGMPNVLIEAINYNVPSVATNVSGVSDLLKNGKGGKILKGFEQLELERTLFQLTKNYNYFNDKTKIAKKYLYRFEIKNASKKYINFLNGI